MQELSSGLLSTSDITIVLVIQSNRMQSHCHSGNNCGRSAARPLVYLFSDSREKISTLQCRAKVLGSLWGSSFRNVRDA